jgi:hypothetical protein
VRNVTQNATKRIMSTSSDLAVDFLSELLSWFSLVGEKMELNKIRYLIKITD